jgi:hypothetical protein
MGVIHCIRKLRRKLNNSGLRNSFLTVFLHRWAYFLHQNLIDTESDNWNLFAQFSDDPTFTYDRLQQYEIQPFIPDIIMG